MVTLAFAIIGTPGGGAFVEALWTMAAIYVDTKYVMPKLIGTPDRPTRLGDMRVQQGDEGMPMTIFLGESGRIPGHIIWSTDLVERRKFGSGFGGGMKQDTSYWYKSLAIGICDNELEKVQTIYLNGKIFYDDDPYKLFISNKIRATANYDPRRYESDEVESHTALVDGAIAIGDATANLDNTTLNFFNVLNNQRDILFTVAGDSQTYRADSIVDNGGGSLTIGFSPSAQTAWADNALLTLTHFYAIQSFISFHSEAGGPDLTVIRTGFNVAISGFAHTDINGSFLCTEVAGPSGGGITSAIQLRYSRSGESSHRVENEPSGEVVTIQQGSAEGVSKWDPKRAAEVTIYLGTDNQAPDPLIESHEGGPGNVSGHQGHAYVVIKNLYLGDSANFTPNAEIVPVERTGRTVGEALGILFDKANRLRTDPIEYDTSACTAVLAGFSFTGIQELESVITPIIIAYDLVAYDDAGVLTIVPRSSLTARTIPEAKIGAFVDKQDLDPIEETDPSDAVLPSAVTVKFTNSARRHQSGSVTYRINNAHSVEEPVVIDLSMLTMTRAFAYCLAKRILISAHAGRFNRRFRLPPSEILTRESELLQFQAFGETISVITREVNRGQNYLIEVEGINEDQDALLWPSCEDEIGSGAGDGDLALPPYIVIGYIDIAPLSAAQAEIPGYYISCCSSDVKDVWFGAILYHSVDDSVFTELVQAPVETTIGVTTEISSLRATVIHTCWDRSSSFSVRLFEGELVSVTEDEVLAGANQILVGTEIIGFTTAVLQASGDYLISGLARGLYDTQDSMSHTVVGEQVILLDDSTGRSFITVNYGDVGTTKYFKGVPNGGVVADYDSISQQIGANTMRVFAPGHLKGVRDGATGDLTISWMRRSRAPLNWWNWTDPGLFANENPERYEVDILASQFGAVLRTLSVSGDTEVVYPATGAGSQTTDFGSPQAAIWVKDHQIANFMGRGKGTKELL